LIVVGCRIGVSGCVSEVKVGGLMMEDALEHSKAHLRTGNRKEALTAGPSMRMKRGRSADRPSFGGRRFRVVWLWPSADWRSIIIVIDRFTRYS